MQTRQSLRGAADARAGNLDRRRLGRPIDRARQREREIDELTFQLNLQAVAALRGQEDCARDRRALLLERERDGNDVPALQPHVPRAGDVRRLSALPLLGRRRHGEREDGGDCCNDVLHAPQPIRGALNCA